MAQAFPGADLFALTYRTAVDFDFGGRTVNTTFLDRWGALRTRRALTLPVMPLAWRAIRIPRAYDRVLTSSHACVKAFPPARAALHFCYCHSPMRYAWEPGLDRRNSNIRLPVDAGLACLRRWDRRSSESVDSFAANSSAVQDRIAQYYGRSSRVIFPPVDVDFYTPSNDGERTHVLAVSRFVPYKRLDLAIEACAKVGAPLVLAGSGPGERSLRQLAATRGADVTFEVSPSDQRLRTLYRSAVALLFPAHEDFGIIPVEAQACGTPVVSLDVGGARDTVAQGVSGYRVSRQDAIEIADALLAIQEHPPSPEACCANARRFSRDRFAHELRAWVGG